VPLLHLFIFSGDRISLKLLVVVHLDIEDTPQEVQSLPTSSEGAQLKDITARTPEKLLIPLSLSASLEVSWETNGQRFP